MKQLLTCEQCGATFPRGARGPAGRYCSGTCKARACEERARNDGRLEQWRANRRQTLEAQKVRKPCPYCGQTMGHGRRVQCGAPKCQQAYQRQRMREDSRKRRAKEPKPPPFSCAQCGERCTPGENVASHATKFCGATCKGRWHVANPRPEIVAKQRRARRRSAAERKLRRAAAGSTGTRVWRCGPCIECGQSFTSQHGHAACCSVACINRSQRRRNRRKYRAKHGSDSHRARARRFGVAYEPIDRDRVFADDEWLCGVCGEPTDPNAAPCTPLSPSLDHIVPISRGGPHVRDNVQCAHFECNWRKSDALETVAA